MVRRQEKERKAESLTRQKKKRATRKEKKVKR